MKLKYFYLAACIWMNSSAFAWADETEIFRLMEEAIVSTPDADIAREEILRSQSMGEQLQNGDYEFELSASGGYRRVEDPLFEDMGFEEWSLDLTRTVRLPRKRQIDQALAEVETDIARANRERTYIDERLFFVRYWNNWIGWHEQASDMQGLSEAASQLAQLEQEKVDAGAGRQIDADLLAAEADRAKLVAYKSKLRTDAARARLERRYPAIIFPNEPVTFELVEAKVVALRARPVDFDVLLRAVNLEAERARLQSQRAYADRRPDPTFGVGLRSEFGGDETAIVGSFSIPLGSRTRKSRSDAAAASARIVEAERRRALQAINTITMEVQTDIDQTLKLLPEAQASLDHITIALNRLQAGYDLGEVPIDKLINIQRRHMEASNTVTELETTIRGAYLQLLVLVGD